MRTKDPTTDPSLQQQQQHAHLPHPQHTVQGTMPQTTATTHYAPTTGYAQTYTTVPTATVTPTTTTYTYHQPQHTYQQTTSQPVQTHTHTHTQQTHTQPSLQTHTQPQAHIQPQTQPQPQSQPHTQSTTTHSHAHPQPSTSIAPSTSTPMDTSTTKTDTSHPDTSSSTSTSTSTTGTSSSSTSSSSSTTPPSPSKDQLAVQLDRIFRTARVFMENDMMKRNRPTDVFRLMNSLKMAAAQQSSASSVQRYLMTGIEPSDVSSLLEQQRSLVASNAQAKAAAEAASTASSQDSPTPSQSIPPKHRASITSPSNSAIPSHDAYASIPRTLSHPIHPPSHPSTRPGQRPSWFTSHDMTSQEWYFDMTSLQLKIATIADAKGLRITDRHVYQYIATATQDYLKNVITQLITISKHRVDQDKKLLPIRVTSEPKVWLASVEKRQRIHKEKMSRLDDKKRLDEMRKAKETKGDANASLSDYSKKLLEAEQQLRANGPSSAADLKAIIPAAPSHPVIPPSTAAQDEIYAASLIKAVAGRVQTTSTPTPSYLPPSTLPQSTTTFLPPSSIIHKDIPTGPAPRLITLMDYLTWCEHEPRQRYALSTYIHTFLMDNEIRKDIKTFMEKVYESPNKARRGLFGRIHPDEDDLSDRRLR